MMNLPAAALALGVLAQPPELTTLPKSVLLHPEFTKEYCADSIAANWILTFYSADAVNADGKPILLDDDKVVSGLIKKVEVDCDISIRKAARAVSAAIRELCGKRWPCIRDDVALGDGT